jgi:hypothetical protein
MTVSSTNHKLRQNIARVLKNKPKVIITENGNVIQVNSISVVGRNGFFRVLNNEFTSKKCAVAYAIATATQDHAIAQDVLQINRKLDKYNDDLYVYNHHMSKNPTKDYLGGRISHSTSQLVWLSEQLDKTLKSIKIA